MHIILKAFSPAIAIMILLASSSGAEPSPDIRQREIQKGCASMEQSRRAKIGKPAPDFSLDAVVGREFKKVSLSEYRGKWVVLFFYPLDFTAVCPTEIKGFNKALDDFSQKNTVILAVSVDSKWSHKAWIERGDLGTLNYPLLSDLKKNTARDYGVLDEEAGVALRGLFIIDDRGILQYLSVNNLSVGRSIEETMRVLDALQTGELCPLNWKPGQKTLGK
jgi:alkyl hydroperoxide reductase subunit AhpC